MTIIETGTQEQVLAEITLGAGSTVAEGSVKSDSILVSLWVTSISGTLDVVIQTLTDEGKLVEVFHTSTISAPTPTLITRASGPILQRFRIVATYTGVCDYEIYVRGINNMGTVGDVSGPATATDNAIARFDGTDGKSIQNSPDTIDDAGNIALPALATVDGRDISVDGASLDSHIANTSNPHGVTKAQVGLGNVTNNLQLTAANNLSDLTNTTTARTNLGVAIGTNVQAHDATLDSLAAFNTNGLLTQTAADTFTGRSIAVTAGDLTVTNGNGVAGNPTLALATTAVTAGTYNSPGRVAVDSRGRVTSIADGPVDPTFYTYLFDDFLSSTFAGNTGWTSVASGAGTGPVAGGLGDLFNRCVGTVAQHTGSTSAGRSTLYHGTIGIGCDYGAFSIQYRVDIPVLSDGTDTYSCIWGFGDTTGAAIQQVNGIYFRYDSTTSSNWILETANGSVRTSTISSTAVTAGTAAWTTLRIDVNAAGTLATYSVNGTSIGTVSTNLPVYPTQFTPLMKIVKSVGTNDSVIYTDYAFFKFTFSSAR